MILVFPQGELINNIWRDKSKNFNVYLSTEWLAVFNLQTWEVSSNKTVSYHIVYTPYFTQIMICANDTLCLILFQGPKNSKISSRLP